MPFGYFVKTRLNNKAALLFHGYAEFLLGILLLLYAGFNGIDAITSFAIYYLAFISIYEIGYIFNDFVSVKFEKNPRKRLQDYVPSNSVIITWIIIRVLCFIAVIFFEGVYTEVNWWLFYTLLILVFAVHNIIKKSENKIFTFFSLAGLRFYAPLFFILPEDVLQQTLPPVVIHYMFYRTLTYIDSKGLLNIPNRKSLSFKLSFYLYLIPLSILIYIITTRWLCIYINIYFLIFWFMLSVLAKKNKFSSTE